MTEFSTFRGETRSRRSAPTEVVTTQSTRYGDQELIHLEIEPWKNTLETITSLYYSQVD